jgi:hypothetical protein
MMMHGVANPKFKNMKLDIFPFYIKNTLKMYVKYAKVQSITEGSKEVLNVLTNLFFNL